MKILGVKGLGGLWALKREQYISVKLFIQASKL